MANRRIVASELIAGGTRMNYGGHFDEPTLDHLRKMQIAGVSVKDLRRLRAAEIGQGMTVTLYTALDVRHPAERGADPAVRWAMNTTARMVFLSAALALTLPSACAAAYAGEIYASHADVY